MVLKFVTVKRRACCASVESTAAGFPLNDVAEPLQDLKNSIKKLLGELQDQCPQQVEALLLSGTHPWQAIQRQWQQESRSSSRMRLQRAGIVHIVLLQLENSLWSRDIGAIFCFCLKQQVL